VDAAELGPEWQEACAFFRSTLEHIAGVLREEYPPNGIPPWGKGWGKEADEKLEARGIDTSRAQYFRAVELNHERLANATAGWSQL
jgi:hypothetical protein